MEEKEELRYGKFKESRQEKLRLELALEGFFSPQGISEEAMETYGAYLKRRIRPAVEKLIEEEEIEKIEALEQRGWFGEKELENFIVFARDQGKTASLICLLHIKDRKYGYKDRDFSL